MLARDGAVWVCGACGKFAKDRLNLGDTSCYMYAVECRTDSLKFSDDGCVTAATAIERDNDAGN